MCSIFSVALYTAMGTFSLTFQEFTFRMRVSSKILLSVLL